MIIKKDILDYMEYRKALEEFNSAIRSGYIRLVGPWGEVKRGPQGPYFYGSESFLRWMKSRLIQIKNYRRSIQKPVKVMETWQRQQLRIIHKTTNLLTMPQEERGILHCVLHKKPVKIELRYWAHVMKRFGYRLPEGDHYPIKFLDSKTIGGIVVWKADCLGPRDGISQKWVAEALDQLIVRNTRKAALAVASALALEAVKQALRN